MRRLALVAAAAAALAGPAAAASLALPSAPDFVPKYSQKVGTQAILEMTPRGESVTRWTRMITLQTFEHLDSIPEAQFVAQFAKRYTASCPGARAAAVPMGADGGVRLDCARTNETVFARAIDVGPTMSMVQIAFKGLVLPKDAAWARDWLGHVAIRP